MKKNYLLIVSLWSILCAIVSCNPEPIDSSQNKKNDDSPYNYLLDSVITYGSSDTTKNIYTYSGDKRTMSISYDWKNNQWENSVKWEFTYSGDKNTEKIGYLWKNNQWEISGKIGLTYSGDKNTEVINYLWENNQWEISTIWKASYTGDTITEDLYYYWRDNQWNPVEKTEYTYMGNIETRIVYSWDDIWENETKKIITYNGDNMEIIGYMWKDNQWFLIDKIIETYDSHGQEIAYETYKWKNEEWVAAPSTYYENKYIPETDCIKSRKGTTYHYNDGTVDPQSTWLSYYYWTITEKESTSQK